MDDKKQIFATLSNEDDFSVEKHLKSLKCSGLLKTYAVGEVEHTGLTKVGAVLFDDESCEMTVVTNGIRTDITTLQINGERTFSAEQFRRFCVALRPLWAGMNVGSCVGMSPICSSGAHLFEIPSFSQFSYWSVRYGMLFKKKLQELNRFDFCSVSEYDDGCFVVFKSDGRKDLRDKTKLVEDYICPDGFWEGKQNVSDAVRFALINSKSLEETVKWMNIWRTSNAKVAYEQLDTILIKARMAVRERGRRRRIGDMCSILSHDDSSVTTSWIQDTFDGMVAWIRRAMAAGLRYWAVIIGDFITRPQSSTITAFTVTVFNSCMQTVAIKTISL